MNMGRRLATYITWALLAALPFYYFRFNLLGVPANPIELAVVAVAILAIFYGTGSGLPKKYFLPVGLIMAGMFLGCLVAPDKHVALGILKSWIITPILLAWAIGRVFDNNDYEALGLAALVSAMWVSAFALLQYYGRLAPFSYQGAEINQYTAQGRLVGMFESPNFLAMYLVPLVVLSFGWLRRFSNLWLIVLLLPLIVVGMTGSRAAVLALVIVALLWIWQRTRSVMWRWGVAVVLAVVAVAGLIDSARLTSNSQHLLIWHQAWLIGIGHPILGIGPGQFQSYFSSLGDGSASYQAALAYALHPHNIFLAFWLYGGVLALAGFVWILILVWKDGLRQSTIVTRLAAFAIVAVIVQGLFDTTYFKNDLAIIFWLLVSVVVLQDKDKKNEDRT